LQAFHQTISKDIKWRENKIKTYYDKKREDAPVLKKREKVYLLQRTIGQKKFNIPSKRPNNKLDTIKYRPFRIQEKLANNNYKLQLPARIKIHPVFHISLLEPTKNPENNNNKATEDEYKVKRILKRKLVEGRIFYLVSWKGYRPEHNS
jgi:hypothetical protein